MPGKDKSPIISVSVIIPVYGVEKYLADCLDSVLGQTMTEIEILCIDDASPDRCPKILDYYSSKDPRVRVFHLPENRKQGYGRNLGFKEARGKYVYFLDSDDLIVPEAMEVLFRIAEKENLQSILFDSHVIFESEELRSRFSEDYVDIRKGTYEERTITGMELADQMLANNEWTVLVQREFWLRKYLTDHEICFPEGAEHEDQFFSIASILAAERILYLPEQLFIRRYRSNSVVTSRSAPKNFHGYLVNIIELIAFLRKTGLAGRPVDILLKKLFVNLDRLYPVFLEGNNAKEWFQTDQVKDIYTFYHYSREAREWKRDLDEKLFAPLEGYKQVWIYGAGRVGQSVFSRLRGLGMIIGGYIVTDMKGNPDQLNRKKVMALDDYMPGEDDVIVVAMARDLAIDVSKTLRKLGLLHFLYFADTLKGPF